MNKFMSLILLAVLLLSHVYVFRRIFLVLPFPLWVRVVVLVLLFLIVVSMVAAVASFIDVLPIPVATVVYEVGTSWFMVLLYLVLAFGLLDVLSLCRVLPKSVLLHNPWTSLGLFLALSAIFVYGNVHYNHKYRATQSVHTSKAIDGPKKIVLVSDLHLGFHNQCHELERWVSMINAERPDLVLVAGDVIDNSLRPVFSQNMAGAMRAIEAPVFASLGNHEYYAGRSGVERFFREADVNLLVDSVTSVAGITVIGRDDRTNPHRLSIQQIMQKFDVDSQSRFTILLDHQPFDLEQAQLAGIDYQFSGHTHYGQVWPVSWITDVIYEDAFGPLRKGNTHYYVSSGLGIWGAKFRIGTRSEYVVLAVD